LRLLPHAFEVRAALNSARRAIDDIGIPSGPMVIGCRKSTSALHLTRILGAYVTTYPLVDVQIRTETSPLLTQQVLERRIEGAFVCDPVSHPELISETILDEELVIFTALNINSLAELPVEDARLIVLGQGSLYEQQLKAALTRQGIATGRVMELGTLENIIGCVSAGLGVTLLPRAVIDVQSAHGTIRAHKVPGDDCRVQTLFIRRRDSFVSSALSAFLATARNYAKALKA
jgi:DNA-binding transcriptional LysR family regulator